MSKVTEAAKREAAKAEAENPDEPTTDEPTPGESIYPDGDDEPDEGDAPGDEPVNAEAQLRGYVKEMERHTDEWARLSGVDPQTLEACPTCSGAGFLDKPLRVSEHHQMCDECNGYGIVISGSLNPNSSTTQCTKCSGYGHVPKVLEAAAATPITNGVTVAPVAPVPNDPPEVAALRAQGYTIVPPFVPSV